MEVFMLFLVFGYLINILCALLLSVIMIEHKNDLQLNLNIPMKVIIVLSILFPFMFLFPVIIIGIYVFARFIFTNL